jgi:hypothetical protein
MGPRRAGGPAHWAARAGPLSPSESTTVDSAAQCPDAAGHGHLPARPRLRPLPAKRARAAGWLVAILFFGECSLACLSIKQGSPNGTLARPNSPVGDNLKPATWRLFACTTHAPRTLLLAIATAPAHGSISLRTCVSHFLWHGGHSNCPPQRTMPLLRVTSASVWQS